MKPIKAITASLLALALVSPAGALPKDKERIVNPLHRYVSLTPDAGNWVSGGGPHAPDRVPPPKASAADPFSDACVT